MICFDSSQKARAAALEEMCTNSDFRSYFGSDEGDVNNGIAVGVENAALFICLSSQGFQDSQYCMKAVCYADQCKIPLLCIDDDNSDWKPSSWLGAVLAAVKHSPKSELIEAIDELCDTSTIKGVSKKTGTAAASNDDIFSGGPVKGYYFDAYTNRNTDMTFDFFKLTGKSVVGQGTDEVGMFVIKGQYTHKKGSAYDCTFNKQYVGQHAVVYGGIIEKGMQGEFTMEGMHNFGTLESKLLLQLLRYIICK